jgi:hypothetical protein
MNRLSIAALTVLFVVGIAGSSGAETWLVTKDGLGDFEEIQMAIDAASPGDEVLVGPGTYADLHPDSQGIPTIVELKSGVVVRTIEGPEETVLDATAEGERRCVSAYGVDAGAVLEGFTVTGGDAPIAGGIYLFNSEARIVRNRVIANDSGAGAGIVCDGATTPVIEENEVIDNFACCGEGGGILCTGGSNAHVLRNEVRENEGFGGGGIALSQSGEPQVIENLVIHNTGLAGGGIATIASGGLIEGNRVLENESQQGGGVAAWSGGGATFTHNIVARNTAQGDGGGYHISADSPILRNETIVANRSFLGAGIFSGNNSSAQIDRCIIAFGEFGEGIWVDDPGSVPEVVCVDVFGNDLGGYGGFIGDLTGVDHNVAVDPLFCDLVGGDYHIAAGSQLRAFAAQNGVPCGIRGALLDKCQYEGTTEPFVIMESRRTARPNPSRGDVWISRSEGVGVPESIEIFDAAGRRVRKLQAGPGMTELRWDGRNEEGRKVPSGVYFIVGVDGRISNRIIVNR